MFHEEQAEWSRRLLIKPTLRACCSPRSSGFASVAASFVSKIFAQYKPQIWQSDPCNEKTFI